MWSSFQWTWAVATGLYMLGFGYVGFRIVRYINRKEPK